MKHSSNSPGDAVLSHHPLNGTGHPRLRTLLHRRVAGQRGRRLRQLAARQGR
ncbi:hypothetical protein H0Z60_18785 [Ectothiorhodospiraceae bacterium WFHF3C12]|nr:hypothetical protein [Ectothiorhodospiraceae bacterium WFHF3C12]